MGEISVQATIKKWADIRAKRFSAEELRQIDQQIQADLLEMERLERSGQAHLAGGGVERFWW
jgi:hypothetical protein